MNKSIKKIGVVRISFIVPIVFLTVIHLTVLQLNDNAFYEFYKNDLRSNLFTAFLTLGGFLYSLKTFIVIKMKENVYDHKKYQDRIKEKRLNNSKIQFYGSLRRLSNLLYYTVLISLFSSFLQFTLGFYEHWSAAIICSYFSIVCISMFAMSLIIIKNNLNFWFDYLEDEAVDAEEIEKSEKAETNS